MSTSFRLRLSTLILSLSAWAAAGYAQEGARFLAPQEFGVSDEVTYNLNPSQFQAIGTDPSAVNHSGDVYVGVASGQGGVAIVAPIHLPTGVRITAARVYYYDSHPDADPLLVALLRYNTTGTSTSVVGFSFPDFSGGYNSVDGVVDTDLDTISNESYHYGFVAALSRSTVTPAEENRIVRVGIRYVRQVSPPPHVAHFDDVAFDHPYFKHIEALFASGITSGCQTVPPLYCPEAFITRGEMAVFLAKALGLHWPPPM